MYDKAGPHGEEAKTWAMAKLVAVTLKYPQAQEFETYIEDNWLFRAHMWVVGYRTMPYARQDINVVIKSYMEH